MRAIVQRVSSASVSVDNEIISSIGRGLMVLVGISKDDTADDVAIIANKILNLKLFSDATGAMWKTNVKDIDGDVLCVSQFTLFGDTTKNKPDFHRAMAAEQSKHMYESFLNRMRLLHKAEKIQDGCFGAMMNVSLTNEGPVTFTLDSRKFEYINQPTKAVRNTSVSTQNAKTAEVGKKRASQSDEQTAVTAGQE